MSDLFAVQEIAAFLPTTLHAWCEHCRTKELAGTLTAPSGALKGDWSSHRESIRVISSEGICLMLAGKETSLMITDQDEVARNLIVMEYICAT